MFAISVSKLVPQSCYMWKLMVWFSSLLHAAFLDRKEYTGRIDRWIFNSPFYHGLVGVYQKRQWQKSSSKGSSGLVPSSAGVYFRGVSHKVPFLYYFFILAFWFPFNYFSYSSNENILEEISWAMVWYMSSFQRKSVFKWLPNSRYCQ